MAEMHPIHWFESAYEELDSAHIMFNYGARKFFKVSYDCYQVAEKMLNGYIIFNFSIMPPYTLDLLNLLDLCISTDSSFNLISSECQRLNLFGVKVKYPNEVFLDQEVVRQAIVDAETIYNFEPLVYAFAKAKDDYQINFTQSKFSAMT
jgi:HEPN domain-containing protein